MALSSGTSSCRTSSKGLEPSGSSQSLKLGIRVVCVLLTNSVGPSASSFSLIASSCKRLMSPSLMPRLRIKFNIFLLMTRPDLCDAVNPQLKQ